MKMDERGREERRGGERKRKGERRQREMIGEEKGKERRGSLAIKSEHTW